jgi:hypothetical protein
VVEEVVPFVKDFATARRGTMQEFLRLLTLQTEEFINVEYFCVWHVLLDAHSIQIKVSSVLHQHKGGRRDPFTKSFALYLQVKVESFSDLLLSENPAADLKARFLQKVIELAQREGALVAQSQCLLFVDDIVQAEFGPYLPQAGMGGTIKGICLHHGARWAHVCGLLKSRWSLLVLVFITIVFFGFELRFGNREISRQINLQGLKFWNECWLELQTRVEELTCLK